MPVAPSLSISFRGGSTWIRRASSASLVSFIYAINDGAHFPRRTHCGQISGVDSHLVFNSSRRWADGNPTASRNFPVRATRRRSGSLQLSLLSMAKSSGVEGVRCALFFGSVCVDLAFARIEMISRHVSPCRNRHPEDFRCISLCGIGRRGPICALRSRRKPLAGPVRTIGRE